MLEDMNDYDLYDVLADWVRPGTADAERPGAGVPLQACVVAGGDARRPATATIGRSPTSSPIGGTEGLENPHIWQTPEVVAAGGLQGARRGRRAADDSCVKPRRGCSRHEPNCTGGRSVGRHGALVMFSFATTKSSIRPANGESNVRRVGAHRAQHGRRIGSSTIDLGNLTGRKPTSAKGQIVYGYLRPYLNKVWVAEFDGYSSVDQFAFAVRPELADTEFIAAFMRSETFLRRSSIVTTTGQLPRIGTSKDPAVPIELPPLDVQRTIVAALACQLAAVDAAESYAAEDQLALIAAVPAALLRAVFNGKS